MHTHTHVANSFSARKILRGSEKLPSRVLDSGSDFLIFPFFFFSYSHSPVEPNLSDILSRFCLLIHSWMAQHLP